MPAIFDLIFSNPMNEALIPDTYGAYWFKITCVKYQVHVKHNIQVWAVF